MHFRTCPLWLHGPTSLISIDLPGYGIKLTLQALQHLMAIPLIDPLPVLTVVAHRPAAASIWVSLRHAAEQEAFHRHQEQALNSGYCALNDSMELTWLLPKPKDSTLDCVCGAEDGNLT